MSKLGDGSRFKSFVSKLKAKGESEHEAKAVAAMAGRKKYGAKRMTQMAVKGRERASK